MTTPEPERVPTANIVDWYFTLVVSVGDNCDMDLLPGVQRGHYMNRHTSFYHKVPAVTLTGAVRIAEAAHRRAGNVVVRLEPDDLVTILDMRDISGIDWNTLVWLANRSDDPMPRPIRRMSSDRPLWSWVGVSRWLAERDFVPPEVADYARAIVEVNDDMGWT